MSSNNYGIARLSVIPLRKEPDDRSEMVTQLLFGETYVVLDQSADNKWLKIRAIFDEYDGWMGSRQHHGISEEYFLELSLNDYRISTEITSTILYMKRPLTIVIGSILPIAASEIFNTAEKFAFNGESKFLSQKRDSEFIIQTASKYLNVPYLWGGKTPFGIDCSGFTQMVFKIGGYQLKRDTDQQVRQGSVVKNIQKVQPGDIAFFINEKKNVSHTGIVLEKNKIIHASGLVRIDNFDERGIFNETIGEYTHIYHSVRRILR
jgi:gamma-D-glutamyl-L-lysine dipeptidyl-peptidase